MPFRIFQGKEIQAHGPITLRKGEIAVNLDTLELTIGDGNPGGITIQGGGTTTPSLTSADGGGATTVYDSISLLDAGGATTVYDNSQLALDGGGAQ